MSEILDNVDLGAIVYGRLFKHLDQPIRANGHQWIELLIHTINQNVCRFRYKFRIMIFLSYTSLSFDPENVGFMIARMRFHRDRTALIRLLLAELSVGATGCFCVKCITI